MVFQTPVFGLVQPQLVIIYFSVSKDSEKPNSGTGGNSYLEQLNYLLS